MVYIWLLIIAGVVLIPIISGAAQELEKRLHKQEEEKPHENKKTKLKTKDDVQAAIKLLTYAAIGIFIVIAMVMMKFISQIISTTD